MLITYRTFCIAFPLSYFSEPVYQQNHCMLHSVVQNCTVPNCACFTPLAFSAMDIDFNQSIALSIPGQIFSTLCVLPLKTALNLSSPVHVEVRTQALVSVPFVSSLKMQSTNLLSTFSTSPLQIFRMSASRWLGMEDFMNFGSTPAELSIFCRSTGLRLNESNTQSIELLCFMNTSLTASASC